MEHLSEPQFLFLFLSFIMLQYIKTYVTFTQVVLRVQGIVSAPKSSGLETAFNADSVNFSISMSITVFLP